MPVSRRVSYILPSPTEPAPLLQLPGIGERRRGVTQPFLVHKDVNSDGFNGHALNDNPFESPEDHSRSSSHPRHCLGINALALDTSTTLSDSSAPAGILYSGGRDGLVASWELGVPHKRRRGGRYETLPGRTTRTKWERVGDGAEMWDDDEDEDAQGENDSPEDLGADEEAIWSSDDDLGDGWVGVDGEGRKRRGPRGEIPYEERWEVDYDQIPSKVQPTRYRQSAQTHTDWVNAMLLCNLNQTVITGSSDRTIRAWSPHVQDSAPALIGRHRDYVRCLAWAKQPALLFSGALDRYICLWDVAQPDPEKPLLQLDLSKSDDWGGVGMEGERGSVYALGTDPAGKFLAAGTPEQVVRLWDPRVGDQSIGKLVGHSDCVRSIIVSDDGRYMLTGSSDTTIKLWSLAAHRCLHTFSHHTSSVWALHSTHPNLERFYSGSRDGHLCAVDVESVGDISDGECVVLAREGANAHNLPGDYESKTGDEGIRSIVAMDDSFVWTATGSAEIKRWKDVGRRIHRLAADDEDDGVSYTVPQGISSSPPPEQKPAPILDPIAHAQDLAASAPLLRTDSHDSRAVAFAPAPTPRSGGVGAGSGIGSQLRRAHLSGTSLQSNSSIGIDDGAIPAHASSLHGIPYESLVCLGLPDSPYSLGFSHAHRSQDLTDGQSDQKGVKGDVGGDAGYTSRRNSIQVDRVQSAGLRARQDFEDRDIASEAKPLRKTPDDVIAGRPGLVRSIILNDRQHVLSIDTDGEIAAWNILSGKCVGRFSAEEVAAAMLLERGVKTDSEMRKHSIEALELVRDRIEGETMIITWCSVDTKIGSLVVHLEEGRVFDAEVYADELGLKFNSKEDIRLNLGKWALGNLFKGLIKAEEESVVSMSPKNPTTNLPAVQRSPEARPIPLDRPQAAPRHRQRALTGSFSGGAPSLDIPGLATAAATPAILPDFEFSKSAPTPGGAWQAFSIRDSNSLSAIAGSPASVAASPLDTTMRGDYFSLRKQQSAITEEKTPQSPATASPVAATPVPSTPGGTKLKFKPFGKKKKPEAPMSTVVENKETPPAEPEEKKPQLSERETEQLTILDTVRAHAFHPPSAVDAPPLEFPPTTALLISEESKDAGAWVVTYRSQVASTHRDMEALEMNSPLWLLDYLFTSRIRIKEPVKLTFILEPLADSGMKEMPEGSTRLSASRILRAKKIMAFIYDKLDLGAQRRASLSSVTGKLAGLSVKRGSVGDAGDQVKPDEALPEDILELLCGTHVVDPKMTLATLKQYYGSGGDMLLHYRFKASAQEDAPAAA
ncbi:hypothetical protein BD324DRAFT_624711 [Kockovaella imperatae]|uniref:Uncharacterized protein n=1 Tax=Kockovaella imperatae TaxID=4999 RepID=A0A1Y1UGA6_9TREE|nr:hypothetical protein BD324DRAFT_624711 [Kockovaella imperatae]ORX37083.1 hypothetical protein BD324DRAFT_624711 [Kockovaella imperatae]